MSQPYTSYEAQVLQFAENGLAASATYLAMVATVPGSLGPLDLVIESIGGVNPFATDLTKATAVSGNVIHVPEPPAAPTTPFVLIHEEAFPNEEVAQYTYRYSGVVTLQFYTLQVAGDAPADILRRVRNLVGGIRNDMAQLFGSTSPAFFMRGTIHMAKHTILDPSTDMFGYCKSDLLLNWSAP